jgi:hypothetical protein
MSHPITVPLADGCCGECYEREVPLVPLVP